MHIVCNLDIHSFFSSTLIKIIGIAILKKIRKLLLLIFFYFH